MLTPLGSRKTTRMDCLWMEGGRRLEGHVDVPAAKNAALPLLCLSLLTQEKVSFENLPEVEDIRSLKKLLEALGVKELESSSFQCAEIASVVAPYEWVRKMRASISVLGPLLARAGKAEVSLPGGCAIGERPVDIHLKGLKALGAKIEIENGYIKAEAKKLKAAKFVMDFPSVGATINIMTAAVLAEGETILENVAKEPEIVETAEMLNSMGAKISGQGSGQIRIQGVSKLGGTRWKIQPDRIQLLTYLAAGVITGGAVTCSPYRQGTLDVVLQKFREMGCEVEEISNKVSLKAPERIKAADIQTSPFPGFPTDGQAQLMACLSIADDAKGATSVIRETVFENRFQHVPELRRMGADIEVKGNTAVVKGVAKLSGASVMASDLRASASLVLAGLRAGAKTQVLRVYHLDRGYEEFEVKLQKLGAKIWRAAQ